MSTEIRCVNCDHPAASPRQHYGGTGPWACAPAPWRDRALAAETRIAELNALVVKITNETPYPDEAKDALAQRGKLVAEIGTLKNRVAKLEGENRILSIEYHGQKQMTAEAVRRWQDAEKRYQDAMSIGPQIMAKAAEVQKSLDTLRREVDELKAKTP